MLALGIVLGLFAQQWAARRMGLDVLRTSAVALLLLAPALLGARLLFVLSRFPDYRRDPKSVWQTSRGGAAMYGGLLAALPLSIPLSGWLGVPFAAFWDTASFVVLSGMIFGRVGCSLAGCCAGAPSNRWFAVRLPNHRGEWRRRIPNQLLEATWGVVILVEALSLRRLLPFPGALFLSVLGSYAIGRTVLESGRERQTRVLGVSLYRALSLALASVAFAVLVTSWRS
jgi:phosphatidylglycerol:prolipoprotein diacylglycerol transferase